MVRRPSFGLRCFLAVSVGYRRGGHLHVVVQAISICGRIHHHGRCDMACDRSSICGNGACLHVLSNRIAGFATDRSAQGRYGGIDALFGDPARYWEVHSDRALITISSGLGVRDLSSC